jgi:hypothetical protein
MYIHYLLIQKVATVFIKIIVLQDVKKSMLFLNLEHLEFIYKILIYNKLSNTNLYVK